METISTEGVTEKAQDIAVEEVVAAIGLDVVYLEHDEHAHFDPISLTAAAALLLLHGYFEGVTDAARSAGTATATKLAQRLRDLHGRSEAPQLPDINPGDVERYGDVAQTVLQTALVEQGFPLRKASALAEMVRQQADALIATEGHAGSI